MSAEPRFYTTSIAAAKTAAEIGELLRQHGATSCTVHYGADGDPVGLSFVMQVPEVGAVPVSIKAQTGALEHRLKDTPIRGNITPAQQSRKVAWRQLKTLIEMQLELVANGVRPFHTMFLGDVMRSDGMTLGEWVEYEKQLPGVQPLALTGGSDD